MGTVLSNHTVTDPRDADRERVLTVHFRVTSWGCAPQTYGPPELCHDGEPIEIDIVRASDQDGVNVLSLLSQGQQDLVESEILEEHEFARPDRDDI